MIVQERPDHPFPGLLRDEGEEDRVHGQRMKLRPGRPRHLDRRGDQLEEPFLPGLRDPEHPPVWQFFLLFPVAFDVPLRLELLQARVQRTDAQLDVELPEADVDPLLELVPVPRPLQQRAQDNDIDLILSYNNPLRCSSNCNIID